MRAFEQTIAASVSGLEARGTISPLVDNAHAPPFTIYTNGRSASETKVHKAKMLLDPGSS